MPMKNFEHESSPGLPTLADRFRDGLPRPERWV